MANFISTPISYISGADYSTKVSGKYTQVGKIVKLSTAADGTVLTASVAGEICVGVLSNAPTLGDAARVEKGPRVRVRLGAAMTRGQNYMANANGDAVVATAGLVACGQIEQSGGIGEIVEASWQLVRIP